MKINKKEADNINFFGKDFEFLIAIKKPNSNLKIKQEFWFKGKVKDLKQILVENLK